MKKAIKKTKQLLELRDLAKNNHEYDCIVVKKDTPALLQAKKLHASVYLDLGFINQTDINIEGVLDKVSDPHQEHSTYFMVKDKKIGDRPIAVARQINYKDGLGLQSFPVLSKAAIANSHLSKIESYNPKEIVEISALVKTPAASSLAPLLLYKFMLDYSLQVKGHKLWLMALDSHVYAKMKYHFGGVLVEIGDTMHLPGGDAVPAMLHTEGIFSLMEEELKNSKMVQKSTRRLLLSFFQVDLGFEFEK